MFTEPYNLAAIAASLFAVLIALHRRVSALHRPRLRARVRGFTLVELIIVIAIVALLVAVALPSYRDHVRKSRRAETAEVARALHAQKVCESDHGRAHEVFDREVN